LYDSAERILKDPEFRQKIFAMNTEKIFFGVQLGAFSTMENAEKAKNKYSKNIDDIKIINKQSGGKRLYVVVAGNYGNRADAENFKKVILKKYSYSGMVIQY
jgi:cell division protein FtsN